MAREPLPLSWYLFFGVFEPVSTVAGAYFALFDTEQFYRDLVPFAFKTTRGAIRDAVGQVTRQEQVSVEAKMGLAQLGSCYLLLAFVSLFLFHTIRTKVAPAHPELATSIISALLTALALADWVHILVTLYFLPPTGLDPRSSLAMRGFWNQLLTEPKAWNGLLFGNVVVTLGLFTARSMWFAGVGRPLLPSSRAKSGKAQ